MRRYVSRTVDFFRYRIWRIENQDLSWPLSFLFRQLQTLTLAARGFTANGCGLRASALTFYSLLSIVPVFAMMFGIAKGFGVAELVENQIRTNFAAQQEVADLLISFSDAFLKHTRGGVVAGLGLIFLFWTVIKMLGQAERALNDIWGITRSRSLLRKFTDYLSLILVCPIMIILSSSMTVALTGALRPVLINVLGPGILDSVFGYILQGVPLAILTFAFGFIYFFLPNTKVSFRPALFGGFIAAIGYYLMQAGYVYFQVSMTRYNAIYGSFAALPLFLIWLQASWLIVLFGAQMAFANENRENFLYEPDSRGASEKTKQQFAISIVGKVIERFQNGERSLSLDEVTKSYKASSQFIRGLLEELTDAGILSAICPDEESDEMPRYQPARPIDQLGKEQIIELMISRGNKSLLELNPDLTR